MTTEETVRWVAVGVLWAGLVAGMLWAQSSGTTGGEGLVADQQLDLHDIPPRRVVLNGAEVREQVVAYLEERAAELAGVFSTYAADVLRREAAAIAGEAHARIEPARKQAARYAEALIAIVKQPWGQPCGSWDGKHHDEPCAWLLAARALGIWP